MSPSLSPSQALTGRELYAVLVQQRTLLRVAREGGGCHRRSLQQRIVVGSTAQQTDGPLDKAQ